MYFLSPINCSRSKTMKQKVDRKLALAHAYETRKKRKERKKRKKKKKKKQMKKFRSTSTKTIYSN